MFNRRIFICVVSIFVFFSHYCVATEGRIIGYYAGNTVPPDSLDAGKLTHLIYCFGKLQGNRFVLRGKQDTVAIREMTALKKKFPSLKIMLSLGGWGGCETCSAVFSTESGREEFSASVKAVSDYFGTDGFDLDWEYPVVKGFPGHHYSLSDRDNLTDLLRTIRVTCGDAFELSFAAGGFSAYIDSSVDWKNVVRYVDFINIMTYDLVHGYSTLSGHHTPLFSTPDQLESTDHAVQKLLEHGVPSDKLVIGCGFYGRVFKINEGYPVERYQPCRFLNTFQFKSADSAISTSSGFVHKFDSVAAAPYAVDTVRRLFATYDDTVSVASKARYVIKQHLGGIMFWQLCDDRNRNGLLDVIYHSMSGR